MSIIEFHKTSKAFGPLTVLDEVDLSIDAGEVVVLVGPSGSGKSTLLRCINALETITGGDLIVDGLSVKGNVRQLREIRQEAGMVFQQFNLFPQLTALKNIAFGPRQVRHLSQKEAEAIAMGSAQKSRFGRQGQPFAIGVVWRSAAAGGHCACIGCQTQSYAI